MQAPVRHQVAIHNVMPGDVFQKGYQTLKCFMSYIVMSLFKTSDYSDPTSESIKKLVVASYYQVIDNIYEAAST